MRITRYDLLVLAIMVGLMIMFMANESLYLWYIKVNSTHGMLASFIKFAILATFGEMLGLRIKSGTYWQSGFGILPKAVVWGVLGLTIKAAFVVFASGVPKLLVYLGFEQASGFAQMTLSWQKVLIAFCISTALNVVYAPVMMLVHKLTDWHIALHRGNINSIWHKIDMANALKAVNWEVQWHFVFKKTIPFFWIPAHTITFLLPEYHQVLFAALLSIALGAILAVASLKSKK